MVASRELPPGAVNARVNVQKSGALAFCSWSRSGNKKNDAAQVGSQERKAVDTYRGLGASRTRQHSGGAQAAKTFGTKLSTMSHSRVNQAAGRLCCQACVCSQRGLRFLSATLVRRIG